MRFGFVGELALGSGPGSVVEGTVETASGAALSDSLHRAAAGVKMLYDLLSVSLL